MSSPKEESPIAEKYRISWDYVASKYYNYEGTRNGTIGLRAC